MLNSIYQTIRDTDVTEGGFNLSRILVENFSKDPLDLYYSTNRRRKIRQPQPVLSAIQQTTAQNCYVTIKPQ